uniref:Toll-like receptor 6 n=1 Tax=Crassostrea virginica TaxID=6565 RepID=A0A8B8ALI2_CRAVI|nr:toll-like receptor 6 [Crassostrea virginica]
MLLIWVTKISDLYMFQVLNDTIMLFIWIFVTGYLHLANGDNCRWTHTNTDVMVDCSGKGLTSIPRLNHSVTYLDISRNDIKALTGSSFESLTELRFLDISHCKLRDVDKGVFGELYNLQYLNISFNRELGFASLPNITYNLNQTKIASLDLNGINCATGIGTIIKRHHLRNIQMTSLKKLSLASNRLELLETGVISAWPKTLQILTLAENKLTAGAYALEVHSLSNLTVLNMSYQLHPPKYPLSAYDICSEKVEMEIESNTFTSNFSYKEFNFNWSMPFPENLEILYAQSSRLFIKDPKVSIHAPSLKHVFLQDNFFLSLGEPISAKHNRIESLDISNNFCSHFSRKNNFTADHLKLLNFSHNDLSRDLEEDKEGEIFKTFIGLEVLDISFNKISSLPRLLLKNSSNLMYINASNNRMSTWMVDISHMYNLIYLDLSENKFASLSINARFQIEMAFQHSINMTVDLSGNVFTCTCENKEFLNWIQKNKGRFRNVEHYTCNTEEMVFDFKFLDVSLNNLRKKCTSYLGWYIVCAAGIAIFFSCMIAAILVKNKWKIRYMIYKTKQRFRLTAKCRHTSTSLQYEYDAFISYSGHELMFVLKEFIPRLEVNKNLKLLIKDRDALPGIPKVDNIMSSLQESRRTICIVSKKYLESKWRDYELNMAKVEGIKDRGTLDYVILVLLPEVYNGGYPHKIIDLVRKDCYIEYPMESCAYDDFWDRLTRMIED